MQLKLEDLAAVKSTGLLPVFGYALVAALLLGLGVGGFVAWKWTAGAQALEENAQLRADAKQWAQIADQQRKNTTEQAAAIDAAIGRLNAISQGREDDREAIRKFAEQLSVSLEKVGAANPALRDLDLGADFLRHWNEANAGPGAAAPAAGAAGEPGAAVPAAPSRDQRQPAGDPGTARQGGGALSRLSQRERAPDRDSARMASNGMELVLQGRSSRGQQAGRLHE